MASRGLRATLARYGAPAAFLLAVTVAVLLVRAGLRDGDPAPVTTPTIRPPAVSTGQSPTGPAPRARPTYYAARDGDTLDSVAARFRTTVEQLLRLNPGVDPTSLRIGQRLRIR